MTGRVADIVTSVTVTGDFAQIYLPGVYVHDFMAGRKVEKGFTEVGADAYAVVRSAYAQLASTCGGRKQRGHQTALEWTLLSSCNGEWRGETDAYWLHGNRPRRRH